MAAIISGHFCCHRQRGFSTHLLCYNLLVIREVLSWRTVTIIGPKGRVTFP
ncbi:hypothetical protein SAMN05192555_1278 [Franzmannia pantelleriensis]|uniref:Uncharacterized protein n=1 Tax=Franzmannia pantelleriensis TaxID=48727 RepID=A0A1G9X4L0_9GAMM|nr:hypothetical protein SAMN05192555_1278 [Halomonas pantelleriensis]